MATPRLTFLYPHLFRSLRVCEPIVHISTTAQVRVPRRQCLRSRGFATSAKRTARFVERHGKAVKPFLAPGEIAENFKVYTPVEDEEGDNSAPTKDLRRQAQEIEMQGDQKKAEKAEVDVSSSAPLSEEVQAEERIPGDEIPGGGKIVGKRMREPEQDELTPRQQAAKNTPLSMAPLETVLSTPKPESMVEDVSVEKPPHLQTPPYVHHFDTYTLVQQVAAGSFTKDQSITAMKAVRGLLALNLDVARAGLVSKNDMENESYLFRAACSELKTEVQNNRRASDERMRRERTLLQHEADILNQKLTQELLTLKDDLKGMFDDRKMAVRMEQRTMDSAIQELSYKITVSLNSDSKSEVEGLRWVLTRRSVMGILVMAFMVLTSLRYASYKAHENDVQRKKREAAEKTGEHPQDLPAQGAAEILTAN